MGKAKDINDIHPTKEELDRLKYEDIDSIEEALDIQSNSKPVDPKDWLSVLSDLNKKHVFINSYGGKSFVTTKIHNEVTNRYEVEFLMLETFKNIYMNKVWENEKGIPVSNWAIEWLKDPDRTTVEGVIYDPRAEPGIIDCTGGKYLNLWHGFTTIPKKGAWRRTLRHIYKILCSSDKTKFKYFMRWLAWCVQNPDKQAEVAIVLKGKKGSGKSFLFVQMKQIFGQHGMIITDLNRLTGKHTAHFRSLSYLFCDEVYYPGDKAIEGRIKALITEPYLDVEGKFKDAVMAKNNLHICMATNNDWVIPATKDERRYYIDVVDERYAKGECSDSIRESYFSKLWIEMNNGGREAMLHFLLSLNIGNWHPRTGVPNTSELIRQKNMSLNAMEQAVKTMLEDGAFPGEYERLTFFISSEAMNNYFEKLEPYAAKFSSVKKANIVRDLGCTKARMTGGKIKWEFPTLKEMRRNWDKKYGANAWDDLEEWNVIKTDF